MIPDTWAFGSVSPSRTSVLVTLNAGTSGRNSYGIGGLVEVFMRGSCRIRKWFRRAPHRILKCYRGQRSSRPVALPGRSSSRDLAKDYFASRNDRGGLGVARGERLTRSLAFQSGSDATLAGPPLSHRSESGGPGGSHPRAPSDPGVTVSRHRALLISSSGVGADHAPVGE